MISVRHLAKHYLVHRRPPGVVAAMRSLFRREKERVVAVDDLSFEIAAGERVGFLGPNGAGKTTTLKMLAGLLHPTSGEVTVAGFTPRLRQTGLLRSIMLVTGQKQQLLWDLPPAETFEMNRAIYDIPRDQYKKTLDELVELLAIGPLLGKPTRQLSLGERMKCELAAALLHRPSVLFLDEPTIGLDVTMQSAMRGFIRSYNERFGATVILTSHYMDDVAALCPRVIVIDRGRLTYDGALDALVRDVRSDKRITLRFATPVGRAGVEAVGGRVVSFDDDGVVLQVEAKSVRDVVGRALAGLPVEDLRVEDAPLEEVIADLFRRNAAKDPPA
jgi:ABC-2 type transport system ATP-binding protein